MPATCVRFTRELILLVIRPLQKREKGIGHGDGEYSRVNSAFVVPSSNSSALMPRDLFSIVVDAASRPRTYVYVNGGLSVCRSGSLCEADDK